MYSAHEVVWALPWHIWRVYTRLGAVYLVLVAPTSLWLVPLRRCSGPKALFGCLPAMVWREWLLRLAAMGAEPIVQATAICFRKNIYGNPPYRMYFRDMVIPSPSKCNLWRLRTKE